jgi:diguanylate cyclase (GGDEF)-like protein
VVFGLAALGMALAVPGGLHWSGIMLVTAGAYAWTLLRAGWEAYRFFCGRIGRLPAAVCAGPLFALGTVLGLRGVPATWVLRDGAAGAQLGAFDTTAALGFLVLGLLLNVTLAVIVTQGVVHALHELTVRDPLTGLLNRRGMSDALAQEQERLRRAQPHGAVLMLDIDHFKRVNDHYGQDTGDQVLAAVAHTLRQSLREVDRAARMGGEEFAVLLVGISDAQARQVTERLHAAIAATRLACKGGELHVTVSIGLVTGLDGQTLLADALKLADQALYRAKREGRNRIVVVDDARRVQPTGTAGDQVSSSAQALAS